MRIDDSFDEHEGRRMLSQCSSVKFRESAVVGHWQARCADVASSLAQMRPLIQEVVTSTTPESLCEELFGVEGVVLLRTALFDDPRARYSFVTAQPFLTFRSVGSHCEIA